MDLEIHLLNGSSILDRALRNTTQLPGEFFAASIPIFVSSGLHFLCSAAMVCYALPSYAAIHGLRIIPLLTAGLHLGFLS